MCACVCWQPTCRYPSRLFSVVCCRLAVCSGTRPNAFSVPISASTPRFPPHNVSFHRSVLILLLHPPSIASLAILWKSEFGHHKLCMCIGPLLSGRLWCGGGGQRQPCLKQSSLSTQHGRSPPLGCRPGTCSSCNVSYR